MRQKLCLVLIAVVLLIALPLRVYQLDVNTDPETGFYRTVDTLVVLLRGVLIAGSAALAVLTLTDRHYYEDAFTYRSRGMGLMTLLLGALLIYVHAMQLYDFFLAAGDELVRNRLVHQLSVLLGFASGIGLVVLSVEIFSSGRPQGMLTAVVILPLCWSLVRVVAVFLDHPTIATIPQNLLQMLSSLTVPLFSLGYARIYANAKGLLGQRQAVLWGSIGGMLGLCYAVPMLVHNLLGGDPMSSLLLSPMLVDVSLSVYMLFFAGRILWTNSEN